MIHFFDGADEITEEYPKGMPRLFNDNEKYWRFVTGYGSGDVPEYDDPVYNDESGTGWNESVQLNIKKNELRVTRDQLLADVDYIFIRHNEELKLMDEGVESGMTTTITNAKYVEFLEYKKELRDLINDITTWDDVKSLTYPTKPTE